MGSSGWKGIALILALLVGMPAAAGEAALAKAIRKGSDKNTLELIANGSGINEADDKGRTPLFYACLRGDGGLIDQLLAKGARLEDADINGDTPLIVLERNTFDVAPQTVTLLTHGAKVNAQNKAGRTPLMEAVLRSPGVTDFRAETALVKVLLGAGADPALRDGQGASAAHQAAAVGEPVSMVRAVLAAAHNPRAPDGEGFDPLMVAVRSEHRNLTRVLFQLGYTPSAVPPRTPAEITKDPQRADGRARADVFAFVWFGDWLTEQGKPADASQAYEQALTFIDNAVTENDRAAIATRAQLAADERARKGERAGALAANIIGAAFLVGTGTGFVTVPLLATAVEADKQKLKALDADTAVLAAERADLQRKPRTR